MSEKIEITISGINISVNIKNHQTGKYFDDYLNRMGSENGQTVLFSEGVSYRNIICEAKKFQNNITFGEYSLLLETVANPIMRYHRFFYHGAAFIWHEKAYLFTGTSGTGKTTQLRHWINLFPDEVEIINGDKPVIEQRENTFIVHPSPWTGKEGWTGTRSAELGGIITLEQGNKDQIYRMNKKDAVFPLFLQFLYKADDEESVDLVCEYERDLIENIPVWKLINTGTEASALLTHKTLTEEGY